MPETKNNQNEDVQDVQDNQEIEDTSTDNGTDNGTASQQTSQATEKTFTQGQVSRMMVKEKRQGRNAAYREMGIDPDDPNSKNMMNMFRAFMQSVQTSEQQATTVVAEQQIKVAEAEARAIKAEAKAEAMQLGLLPQYADDAVVIIMSKLNDDTDVKTVVSELKTKYPVWFGVDKTQQKPKGDDGAGQKGTGSSVGNVGNSGGQKGTSGLGARLAASRKSQNKKSSYFD